MCKINKCTIQETKYTYKANSDCFWEESKTVTNLLKFLLSNRVELEEIIDVNQLFKQIPNLSISTKYKMNLLQELNRFKNNSKVYMWESNNFADQAKIISNIVVDDDYLIATVDGSKDFEELYINL